MYNQILNVMMMNYHYLNDKISYLGQVDNDSQLIDLGMMTEH
jgi:hypothetical protein